MAQRQDQRRAEVDPAWHGTLGGTHTGLIAVSVVMLEQVQALREIRNACAGTFAHDNAQISEQVQRAWWVTMRGRVRAWLYATRHEDIVGYGVLRQDAGGSWWNSVAVLPIWQDRGFGSEITADLLRRHPWPVFAQVRLDNPAADAMHNRKDWQVLGDGDGLRTFISRQQAHLEGIQE